MKTLFILFCALMTVNAWADSKLVGRWKTIDDETGQAKSYVEITQDGDTFRGKIVELINPKVPDPKCEKCSGDKKDQPVLGMEILTGFKETKKDQEWTDGEILDPNNGKTYNCRLRLKDDGNKLEVRGFIGISLFGRSQIWHRASATN